MSELPEPTSEPTQQEGISLRELSEAFAEAMGGRGEPDAGAKEEEAPEAAEPDQTEPSSQLAGDEPLPEADPSHNDDPCEISPRTILEAMLFVGNLQNQPLGSDRAAELMRGVSPGEIPELVGELNRRYASSGCPYEIINEGTGYRLRLCRAFHPVRNRLYGRVREARLSQATVDVLAIVAYRQPLTAEEVAHLRGLKSGHLLAQLVRRQLLRVERRPGQRGGHYYTTDRFLRLFGLESLQDLPQAEDLEKQ